MLAQAWGLSAKAVGRRAWYAAHHPVRVHHELAVSDFFAGLAVASAEWTGCGLYHWMSDDSMRRNHELIQGSLAPDGWGRLLLPSREVIINLEWDAGAEGSLPLVSKMKLYAEQLPPGEHVLFVAPHAPREHAIRQAMRYVLGAETQDFPLFTITVPMLAREGQLGPTWRPIVDDEARARILELEASPAPSSTWSGRWPNPTGGTADLEPVKAPELLRDAQLPKPAVGDHQLAVIELHEVMVHGVAEALEPPPLPGELLVGGIVCSSL